MKALVKEATDDCTGKGSKFAGTPCGIEKRLGYCILGVAGSKFSRITFPGAEASNPDVRMNDPAYAAEVAWIKSQVQATAAWRWARAGSTQSVSVRIRRNKTTARCIFTAR